VHNGGGAGFSPLVPGTGGALPTDVAASGGSRPPLAFDVAPVYATPMAGPGEAGIPDSVFSGSASVSESGPVPAEVIASNGAGPAAMMPTTPGPGPLVCALDAAAGTRKAPFLVVGETVDDDLVLASNLVAAIRTALADSAAGLEWAVAVGRISNRPVVMVTSTEGRGWVPPGLYLPREVNIAWKWESMLGFGNQSSTVAENGGDPARTLVEIGLLASRRIPMSFTAVASSTAVTGDLSAFLGHEIAVRSHVSAVESEVDLSAPGVGLVDRLALVGSRSLRRRASPKSAREAEALCLELASTAHARLQAVLPAAGHEIVEHRTMRKEILAELLGERAVSPSTWGRFTATSENMLAVIRARRDEGVDSGARSHFERTGTDIRSLVFERRVDELLLALRGEPGKQAVRDSLYTYGQVVEHPVVATAPGIDRATATTIAGTAVPIVNAVADGSGVRVRIPEAPGGPVVADSDRGQRAG
jgi:hypothetical protein